MSTSYTLSASVAQVPLLKSREISERPQASLFDGVREDLSLVDRARGGDLPAFRLLVERYQGRLLSVALGLVGNRADAEDLAQETFLKAYRNLKSFRGDSSFYTWLYRIISNLAIDLSRRRYRQRERLVGEKDAFDTLQVQSEGLNTGILNVAAQTADQGLERRELGDSIRAALDSLSPDHRAVIVLREIEGLSYEEISQAVGCSKGTVMSRLFHARKKLQAMLREVVGDDLLGATLVPEDDNHALSKGGL